MEPVANPGLAGGAKRLGNHLNGPISPTIRIDSGNNHTGAREYNKSKKSNSGNVMYHQWEEEGGAMGHRR